MEYGLSHLSLSAVCHSKGGHLTLDHKNKMVKAVAVLSSSEGISFVHEDDDAPTPVTGNLAGLKPGLHVHVLGDATNGCMSTGGHELSKTTGNAGGRVACGIIGLQA